MSPLQPDTLVIAHRLGRTLGERRVIDGLDLRIARGEFVALLGKSGCGKTTLLRLLLGLERCDTGELTVPSARTAVFQEHRLLPWLDAQHNVALGLAGSEAQALARSALAEVGLGAHARSYPLTLSGGEAQRVALARALVRAPELLLLDEPFAALDALTRIQMHALVRALVDRHRPAVLLVTHDVDEALALADRVLVMREGRIARQFVPTQDERLPELRTALLDEVGVGSAARLPSGL